MTIRELEDSLPSGFHDSGLRRIIVDYQRQTVQLDLSLSVGDPEGPHEQWDDYRDATIEISGLVFCVIQSPDARYNLTPSEELWIVDGYGTRSTPKLAAEIDPQLAKRVPDDAFLHSFLVNDWNSFIHISGHSVAIEWKDSDVIKHRGSRQHFAPGDKIKLD